MRARALTGADYVKADASDERRAKQAPTFAFASH